MISVPGRISVCSSFSICCRSWRMLAIDRVTRTLGCVRRQYSWPFSWWAIILLACNATGVMLIAAVQASTYTGADAEKYFATISSSASSKQQSPRASNVALVRRRKKGRCSVVTRNLHNVFRCTSRTQRVQDTNQSNRVILLTAWHLFMAVAQPDAQVLAWHVRQNNVHRD